MSSSGRNKKKGEDKGLTVPCWVLSYSDMVTNLMTLFIVMVSFASFEKPEQSRSIINAFRGGMGLLPSNESVIEPVNSPQAEMAEVGRDMDKFNALLSQEQLTESVRLWSNSKGMGLSIAESAIFAPGKADIDPRAYPILNNFASMIKELPGGVRIEAYADETFTKSSRFANNWELSAARALNVLYYFKDFRSIDPHKLSAVARGENIPAGSNTSGEDASKSGRVEIFAEYAEEK